jgi:hypothetical protein
MAPNGSCKGPGRATAKAKMPTWVRNRCLKFNWDFMKGFISEHIHALILIYNVCGVKDDRSWDFLYDVILLDPVTIRDISQFQLL